MKKVYKLKGWVKVAITIIVLGVDLLLFRALNHPPTTLLDAIGWTTLSLTIIGVICMWEE